MENQTTLATVLNAINKAQKPSDQPIPPKTWAEAVAQCQLAPLSQPQIPTGSHTILIRMEEKEDKEKVKKSTNKEILQDLNHLGVIAVKKLESGDVRIFTITKGVQETLSSDLA